MEQGIPCYRTRYESNFIQANYPLAENISIEFDFMDKATIVHTIRYWVVRFRKLDMLFEITKGKDCNAINTIEIDSCMINVNNHKTVVIKGLQNYNGR